MSESHGLYPHIVLYYSPYDCDMHDHIMILRQFGWVWMFHGIWSMIIIMYNKFNKCSFEPSTQIPVVWKQAQNQGNYLINNMREDRSITGTRIEGGRMHVSGIRPWSLGCLPLVIVSALMLEHQVQRSTNMNTILQTDHIGSLELSSIIDPTVVIMANYILVLKCTILLSWPDHTKVTKYMLIIDLRVTWRTWSLFLLFLLKSASSVCVSDAFISTAHVLCRGLPSLCHTGCGVPI